MYHQYKICIEQYLKCATICNHNVYALLKEDAEKFKVCIQLSTECAILCNASAQLLSVGSHISREVAGLCAQACNACAIEIEKFPESQHCKEAAEICRICIECISY